MAEERGPHGGGGSLLAALGAHYSELPLKTSARGSVWNLLEGAGSQLGLHSTPLRLVP